MDTLVRSYIAFGAHADISPLGCGSPFYSRHVFEQEIHNPIEIYAGLSPVTPFYMSSCNYIIMSFSCLIEPYAGFPDFDYQPYSLTLVSCLAK